MNRTPKEFVKEFQRRVGLDDDGDSGTDTNAALDRVLPPKVKPSNSPAVVVVPASQAGLIKPPGLEAKLAAAIIANARRFCGLKEVRPNQSWDNPDTRGPDAELVAELIAGMRASPWQAGWAYCAAFAEAMAAMGLKDIGATVEQVARFRNVMSPHCMTSVHAFRQLGLLSPNPVPGSIWLARHGTSDQGHAGIPVLPHAPNMDTIEANTSFGTKGNQREGDWITNKIRPIVGVDDLHTQGFVHPISILKICGIS